MSLKSYKNEVYLNYGYLAIEKNFKPANTFEKEAIVNSLWLLSFNRELTDYPEENLNKLILIKENLNYLIKVAEHMQISTEQDHLFIQSILTFFKITSNKKNLLDMFDFLLIKLAGLLTPYNDMSHSNLLSAPKFTNESSSRNYANPFSALHENNQIQEL